MIDSTTHLEARVSGLYMYSNGYLTWKVAELISTPSPLADYNDNGFLPLVALRIQPYWYRFREAIGT